MNEFETLIKAKDIKEILHFTTNQGLLGILRTGAVLPNSQLTEEDTLAFIFQQNSLKRRERDSKWLSYVNLSITKLNFEFFEHSRSVHQYSDIYWVILSFLPEIIIDSGVCFTTTNNIYPSCLRGEGIESFERMFRNPIVGKYQREIFRGPSHLPSWTTCEQAEVLYPGRLALERLAKVYVSNFEDKASIMAQLAVLGLVLDVEVCPNKFRDDTNDN
ncbi:DarT ssDNA thymidine ADP-ribosyltransferase family protein [Dickeya undicola]|uniref:DarT ssDNA thymidine ADP-ribosyltransferase family protein n=1 Tax=Dickeya undicola TaxID=1577887 RepID=UPI000532DE44|nr:DarT ssDNA thymidine ADP-ribosyltransferase family protein [Dickeya undicola]